MAKQFILQIVPVMTAVQPALPKTYFEMFCFLAKGSGIWAMAAVLCLCVFLKSYLGYWRWYDPAVFLAIFLARGVIEWMIHSWLYHGNPVPLLKVSLKGETWRQHMQHHRDPRDLSRLLITYKGVFVLSGIVYFLALAISFDPGVAATAVLGFIIVGVMIEVVHLMCHCEIPHRKKSLEMLVRLHRRHHHEDSCNYYGVSSSLGDRLFGTYPDSGGG